MFLRALLTPLALRMSHHPNTAAVRKMGTARGQKSGFHPAQLQGCSVLRWYAQILGRAFTVARGCARHNRSWHAVTLKPVTRIAKSMSGRWVQWASLHLSPGQRFGCWCWRSALIWCSRVTLLTCLRKRSFCPLLWSCFLAQALAWSLPKQYCNHVLDLLSLTLVHKLDFLARPWTCLIAMELSDHPDSGLSLAAIPSLSHSPRSRAVGLPLVGEATALTAKVPRPHPLLLPDSLAPSACCCSARCKKKTKIKKKRKNLLQLHTESSVLEITGTWN